MPGPVWKLHLEVAFESCAVCKFRGPVWSGKGTFTARHKGRERTHEKKREKETWTGAREDWVTS